MKQIACFLLFSSSFAASADMCKPADLRNQAIAPIRSQMYENEGKEADSRYCYAYMLANLIGQELGTSVAPVDIVIQYMKTWSAPFGPDNQMFPLTNGWGGEIGEAFSALKKVGYCTTGRFKKYQQTIQPKGMDWYLSLNQQTKIKSPEEIFADVDQACAPRQKESATLKFHYEQNDESVSPANRDSLSTLTAQRMIRKIDSLLEAGRFVALSYDDHYVTIVGRLSSCEYIIQDSIPHSHRQRNEYRNLYHRVEGEHIQFWTPQALNKVLHFPRAQGGGQIPGIGYLE